MVLLKFLLVSIISVILTFFVNCHPSSSSHPINEDHIIQKINSIFFNDTGNFTFKHEPFKTTNRFFGQEDFFELLANAQDFVAHQINSAEKSINDLEIRARESLNVSGIVLNRLVHDTEQALKEFRAQIEEESRTGKMSDCLESRSHVQILEVISDARDQIRQCAKIANHEMNKQLKKVHSSIEEITRKVLQLKRITHFCWREPGIGEKLNCFLAKTLKVGQILHRIVTVFRETMANTAENFAVNVRRASLCMTQISHEAIRDVNGLVTVARECAQANSIAPVIDIRAQHFAEGMDFEEDDDFDINDEKVSEVTTTKKLLELIDDDAEKKEESNKK